jgi:hypothetical protein
MLQVGNENDFDLKSPRFTKENFDQRQKEIDLEKEEGMKELSESNLIKLMSIIVGSFTLFGFLVIIFSDKLFRFMPIYRSFSCLYVILTEND